MLLIIYSYSNILINITYEFLGINLCNLDNRFKEGGIQKVFGKGRCDRSIDKGFGWPLRRAWKTRKCYWVRIFKYFSYVKKYLGSPVDIDVDKLKLEYEKLKDENIRLKREVAELKKEVYLQY